MNNKENPAFSNMKVSDAMDYYETYQYEYPVSGDETKRYVTLGATAYSQQVMKQFHANARVCF